MPAYNYRALAEDGKVHNGVLEGDSERQVRTVLRNRQLKPLEVFLHRSVAPTSGGAGGRALAAAVLVLVTRQLATLVAARVPLDEALAACARQQDDPRAKALVLQVRGRIAAGESLGSALAGFPRVFPPLYIALVRAGEQAGKLAVVLDKAAGYLEQRQLLRQQMQLALIYPLTLVAVAIGVVALLMVLVLPELAALFLRTDTPLPLLTRVLMGTSAFLAAYWWALLLMVVVLVMLGRILRHHPTFDHWRDGAILRLPVVGRLQRAADTARFAATLSLLSQSGVALVEAIGIATGVMGNVTLRRQVKVIAERVEAGGSLAQAMTHAGCFPPLMTQLVASGESSGTLDAMLERAARNQEQELNLVLNGLLRLLEPLIVVVMAIVIGAIVLAVLLPVMQMNTLVR